MHSPEMIDQKEKLKQCHETSTNFVKKATYNSTVDQTTITTTSN